MSCVHCPCPDICRRLPAYCQWAAKDPPDSVEIGHICAASARHAAAGGLPEVPSGYPPIAVQAEYLARALWDWAVSGFTVATEDEQARRLMVCAGCSYFEPAARRCHLCGCHLMAKVGLRTAHCPLPEPKW